MKVVFIQLVKLARRLARVTPQLNISSHPQIIPWHAYSGGEAEDFIERSLEKVSKEDGKRADPAALLTTQREALSLYRAVWRASFLFVWKNEKGETWLVHRSDDKSYLTHCGYL